MSGFFLPKFSKNSGPFSRKNSEKNEKLRNTKFDQTLGWSKTGFRLKIGGFKHILRKNDQIFLKIRKFVKTQAKIFKNSAKFCENSGPKIAKTQEYKI